MTHWVSWAGLPKQIVADRGLNNRGVFLKEMSAAGVNCGIIGLEAPNQLGKTERHGGMWKDVAEKVGTDKKLTTPREMTLSAAETHAQS